MRKGVQVYTVRNFIETKEGYVDTLKKIKNIGYDSVQTYGNHFSDQDHKALLDEIGLYSESVNGDFEDLLKNPAAIELAVKQCEIYGVDYIAIGTLPEQYRDSRDGFSRFAEEINHICKTLKKSGKKLLYHPHALEFFSLGGGKAGMDILTGDTDPDVFWFCLDTHWIQSGGRNPADYISSVKGRLPIVHFKDYKIAGGAGPIEQVKKAFAEVGEGNLCWPAIIKACREAQVPAVVVEQDVCDRDPFACLWTSYQNMVKLGL